MATRSSTITVIDMFCGCGGSTTGATLAGADVRLALNHWERAIETHNTNYPDVEHRLTDLLTVRPNAFPSATMLIASPECTSHSLAKGRERKYVGQPGLWEARAPDPAEERSRCTMYTPLDWAEYHDFQLVILENVEDIQYWRPLQGWLLSWKNLDYDYEFVHFNSMFAWPTPQSRDRVYFVAWKKGNRKPDLRITPKAYCVHCAKDVGSMQAWKHPLKKWGKYGRAGQYVYCCPLCTREVFPYYYAAASAIDWQQPIQRIGDRKHPLKEKTLRRITDGLEKFAGDPFSIPMTRSQDRLRDMVQEPFPTQTATETQGLVVTPPFLVSLNHTQTQVSSVQTPWPTQTTYDDTGLVVPSPFLLDQTGEYRPRSLGLPMSTVVGGGNHQSLVIPPAWLMTYYNNGQFLSVDEAVPTVTTLERHALVTATSEKPQVEQCGFRMLHPQEIQAAMAFPREYIVTGTRREQVKQLGNAVTPPVMQLLVSRALASLA